MFAVGQPMEGPGFRCRICGAGDREEPRPAASIPCPLCGQPVADVSNVLSQMSLPASVVELLPTSVARENRVIVFSYKKRELVIAIDLRRTPLAACQDLLDKLRFILNREIRAVHASQAAIDFAIEREYGPDDESG